MGKQILTDYSVLDLQGDAAMFWEKRFENDGDGNPIYIGYTRQNQALVTDLVWFIVKITYTGGFPTYYELPVRGVRFIYDWNSRASYFS